MSNAIFTYNPITKKWQQKDNLNNAHIIACIGDMVFCPIHKKFERVKQYGNIIITDTCRIECSCYVFIDASKYSRYQNGLYKNASLEEFFMQSKTKQIYAYKIFQNMKRTYIQTFFIKFNEDGYEVSDDTIDFYKDRKSINAHAEIKIEKMHYLTPRLRKNQKDAKEKIPYHHGRIRNKKTFYERKRTEPTNKYIDICDEVADYLIKLEMIQFPENKHRYDFGSVSVHGIKRYETWQNYTDIDFPLIRDKISFRKHYNFSELTNFEIFSIICNEFKLPKINYKIYRENPLRFLKIMSLQKIGFGYETAMQIANKASNNSFLLEYDLMFSPNEHFGVRLSKSNYFAEFLNWCIKNDYETFAKNICLARNKDYCRGSKADYILWKILEITNNLPVLDKNLSAKKFIDRAYIGFDSIAHVFALDFELKKKYKDGKCGDYSYTELLTFQNILKVSKIIDIIPSYTGFLSCILNDDRYIMITKNEKVVGLLLASKGGFKVKSLEEIPSNSLEGWKQANCYYEDKDNYVQIPSGVFKLKNSYHTIYSKKDYLII